MKHVFLFLFLFLLHQFFGFSQPEVLSRGDSNFIFNLHRYKKAVDILTTQKAVVLDCFKKQKEGLVGNKRIIDSLSINITDFGYISEMFRDSLICNSDAPRMKSICFADYNKEGVVFLVKVNKLWRKGRKLLNGSEVVYCPSCETQADHTLRIVGYELMYWKIETNWYYIKSIL
ncbi:MAG: hypothetical protein K2Q22_00355 [Cytophagales bacterium]|nr:hypothetical protein [Cytophagales bacterium]